MNANKRDRSRIERVIYTQKKQNIWRKKKRIKKHNNSICTNKAVKQPNMYGVLCYTVISYFSFVFFFSFQSKKREREKERKIVHNINFSSAHFITHGYNCGTMKPLQIQFQTKQSVATFKEMMSMYIIVYTHLYYFFKHFFFLLRGREM